MKFDNIRKGPNKRSFPNSPKRSFPKQNSPERTKKVSSDKGQVKWDDLLGYYNPNEIVMSPHGVLVCGYSESDKDLIFKCAKWIVDAYTAMGFAFLIPYTIFRITSACDVSSTIIGTCTGIQSAGDLNGKRGLRLLIDLSKLHFLYNDASNYPNCYQPSSETEQNITIYHEVAHAVAQYAYYPDNPDHDFRWVEILSRLGGIYRDHARTYYMFINGYIDGYV